MAQDYFVPCFYDGQDRRTTPVCLLERRDLKERRKSGTLDGWYQENGKVFVIYRPPKIAKSPEELSAGGGFSQAWQQKQSGYAGPLVWQLRQASSPGV
jgi:hypothetical protein